jgi:ABC-2 type transport system permease protein
MKKFTHLLLKEIKELVTKQLVISLVFTMTLFYFIGNVTKSEVKKATGKQDIAVLDLDGSELSRSLVGALQMVNYTPKAVPAKTSEEAVAAVRQGKENVLIVIPQGFGESVKGLSPKPVETFAFIRSFSLIGIRRSEVLRGVISAMNDYVSSDFLRSRLPGLDPKRVKSPIATRDFVLIRDRMAEGPVAAVAGFVSSQTMMVPIILMMIVIYASQMVISAIAMEKQNKTLETLLTVPISRTSIVTAKMLASGLVGLLSAVFYMVGYRYFMTGITGDIGAATGVSDIVKKLGLSMSGTGMIVLGISLFMAILCALALATILGVLAEDFRSAQSLIMPVVLLVMIPYFLTLFSDPKTLSPPAKILLMVIPFSHSFLAVQNIFLGDIKSVILGMLYMLAFFTVLVIIAGRIFSSDKVLTMKLRWGKKKVVL